MYALATRPVERDDHVKWNSEAGRVSSHIKRLVASGIQFKGYNVRGAPVH